MIGRKKKKNMGASVDDALWAINICFSIWKNKRWVLLIIYILDCRLLRQFIGSYLFIFLVVFLANYIYIRGGEKLVGAGWISDVGFWKYLWVFGFNMRIVYLNWV